MGKVGGTGPAARASDLGTWFRPKRTSLFEQRRKDPNKEGESYCALSSILGILLMNGYLRRLDIYRRNNRP